MSTPNLTIAIPVYERTFRFEEALSSALAVQECNEILIVDDDSSHNEFEKISQSKNDPRIRYIKASRNLGIFGNWNRCAEKATGDYITILCSDDIVEPDICKRFTLALEQEPDIDVFFGSFVTLNETTKVTKTIKSFPPGRISTKWFLEDVADKGPGFPVLTITRRKTLLQFPFVATPHSGNDWLWIYSNAAKFNLFADAKPLSYWRRHQNQDAKTSQATTTDCWPLMYLEIASQLEALKSSKAAKARRRATGVVLSWLLNEKTPKGRWYNRLMGEDALSNPFIETAKKIASENILLSNLLKADRKWPVYYNLGRVSRKVRLYHPTF